MPLVPVAIALSCHSSVSPAVPSQGTIRVNNQSAVRICAVTFAGAGGGSSQVRRQDIPTRGHADFGVDPGEKRVCVLACAPGLGPDAQLTDTMGCGRFKVAPGIGHEIVISDEKEPAPQATAPGFLPTAWGNQLNPRFARTRFEPWRDPFGDLLPSAVHVSIEPPQGCARPVEVEYRAARGASERFVLDPENGGEIYVDQQLVALWVDPTSGERRRSHELPPGDYRLAVRGDCDRLELISAEYPPGAPRPALEAQARAAASSPARPRPALPPGGPARSSAAAGQFPPRPSTR